jgi:hypothetical protein
MKLMGLILRVILSLELHFIACYTITGAAFYPPCIEC